MRTKIIVVAALLAACAGSSVSIADGGLSGDPAKRDLMHAFPGVRVYMDGTRERIVYGVPMTRAATPEQAAAGWLREHGDVFGVGELDLALVWSGDVRDSRFWAFQYTQMLGGLSVESSPGRLLMRNNGDGTWSVVYAAGLFAAMPDGGFAPMTRTAQDAVNFVRGAEQYSGLPIWTDPELVVYQVQTAGGVEAVRAWKFVGENPDRVDRERYTFFVDVATGALLEARNEVHTIDVFGFVKGYASPGNLPDESGNSPVLMPVNDEKVQISGGNSAYSDSTGFFDITHGGSSNVTISADFDTGRWCNINDSSGTGVQSVSGVATPGTEAYLEFNSSPTQYKTAQVNGFIHTGLIHNFIRDRTSWAGMDFRCRTVVNINSSCNAYFDGSSINFFRKAGSCNNTAYSTVIAHEYGHYIVSKLGLSQGAFGEGYGDSCSELLYDTGIVGEHFFTSGGFIRDNENTHRQYPCSGGVHSCGQVLGGVWWHMRKNFGTSHGSQIGLEEVRQLFVDWSLITTGGSGGNSAHPGTSIEVLTLDDDDGTLDNGTPNYNEICAAFSLHGIDCPEIIPLIFAYPSGLPDMVSPSGGTTFDVFVSATDGFTAQPGTGVLHVDVGGGFVDYPMTEIADNSYVAEFPAIDCRSEVNFYISAEATDGTQGQDPQDAPLDSYSAYAAEDRTVVLDDNFQDDNGFMVESQNVQAGEWKRALPNGSPPSDYDGSGKAYVTGVGFGNPDLDGGPTRLISPVFDLSGLSDPYLSYARWFVNEDPQEDEDRLTVELSDDGGATWIVVESLTDEGYQWNAVEYRIADFVSITDQVVVRFSAIDAGVDSEVEAGIDAFLIDEADCGGCVADFNGDGVVNTQDMISFLNAWNAGDSSADINGDGMVNSQDVIAFLNLWNAGC